MSNIFSANLDDLHNLKVFLTYVDTQSDELQSKLQTYKTAVEASYQGPNKASLDADLQDLYNHLLQIDTYADKVRYGLDKIIADIQAAENVQF